MASWIRINHFPPMTTDSTFYSEKTAIQILGGTEYSIQGARVSGRWSELAPPTLSPASECVPPPQKKLLLSSQNYGLDPGSGK
jgi:hypothetical protein